MIRFSAARPAVLTALTILTVVTALAVGASPAWAKGKGKAVSILGLEAGTPDMESARTANTITSGLRAAAKRDAAHRAPKSAQRSMLEGKMLAGCDDASVDCLAKIGQILKVGEVIYGTVHHKGSGFEVRLLIVNSRSGRLIRRITRTLPRTKTKKPAAFSTKLYAAIMGKVTVGGLRLRSNVPTGTVFVDGKPAGSLSEGELTVNNLSPGTHSIRISSAGYTDLGLQIEVQENRIRPVDANLDAIRAVSPRGRGNGGSTSANDGEGRGFDRAMLYTSGSLLVAGVITNSIVQWGLKPTADEEVVNTWLGVRDGLSDSEQRAILGGQTTGDPCKNLTNNTTLTTLLEKCDRGKQLATLNNVLWGVTGAAAIATGFFYYRAMLADDGSVETRVTVTPTASADGAGASLEFQF